MDKHLRTAVDMFLARLRPDYAVVDLVLYGSRARGDAEADSDVDLAVVLAGEAGDLLQTKLAMGGCAFDVMLLTDVYIEPMPIWGPEWRDPARHANPDLVRTIQREGVRLELAA